MKKFIFLIPALFIAACESRHDLINGRQASASLPSIALHVGEIGYIQNFDCSSGLRSASPNVFSFSVGASSTTINGLSNGVALLYCGDAPVAGVFVAKPGYPFE